MVPQKKRRPPPRTPVTRLDLSATTPEQVVATVARTHEQPIDTLLLAISVGVLDDGLDRIAATVNARFDALQRAAQLIADATLKVGDRVMLGHNLRPLYLHGQPARVVGKDGEKWVLRLEKPIGRFKNADLRVSAFQIETVTST
jgi:hypothetical protein